jgi:hypothetical protein
MGRRIVVMKLICSLGHCECDGHSVHKLNQRRLTADFLAPRQGDCSRMHSKVSSDWAPNYIKAIPTVIEIFKMAKILSGQPSYFRASQARISQDLQNGFPHRTAATSVATRTALLSAHLPSAGQYAYPNMAVKITLILYVLAVNYSCSPLIIEALGRQLCLPPGFLTLSLVLRYIVLSLVV